MKILPHPAPRQIRQIPSNSRQIPVKFSTPLGPLRQIPAARRQIPAACWAPSNSVKFSTPLGPLDLLHS